MFQKAWRILCYKSLSDSFLYTNSWNTWFLIFGTKTSSLYLIIVYLSYQSKKKQKKNTHTHTTVAWDLRNIIYKLLKLLHLSYFTRKTLIWNQVPKRKCFRCFNRCYTRFQKKLLKSPYVDFNSVNSQF